jgi:hypothetical protein
MNRLIASLAVLAVLMMSLPAEGQQRQRVTKDNLLKLYDLSNAKIDIDDLIAPGVPQDGIPPLTDPKFEKASEADFPPDDARVAVVTINDETVAYPLLILNFHEIVNHTVGGRPIAALYCPLCDSVSVVDRTLKRDDEEEPIILEFGVSGFLHYSNVVMYDRQTNSLWSQVFAQAITGPHAGATLKHLPFKMMTFAEYREKHPSGAILSRETGHQRPYHRNQYQRYFESDRIFHPFEFGDELPPKTLGLGIRAGGFTAFVTQKRAKQGRVTVETPRGKVVVSANESGFVIHESPETVQTVQTFFHSWSAFFRDTKILKAEDEQGKDS